MKILFWIIASGNIAVLLLFFVLGLAAAPSSHTSGFAVAGYMLVIPLLLVGGSVFLFMRGSTPLLRAVGFLMQAAPLIVLVWLKTMERAKLSLATDAQGTLAYFHEGPLRDMVTAIAKNDSATVAALASKANVNTMGYANTTLLSLALKQLKETPQQLGVLRALLHAGADANLAADQHPLTLALQGAATTGSEPVKLLLAAGAKPNMKTQFGEPLWYAAMNPGVGTDVFDAMLAAGADIKAADDPKQSPLLYAANIENWRTVLWMLEHGVDWKPVRDVNGLPFEAMAEQRLRSFGEKDGQKEVIAYMKSH